MVSVGDRIAYSARFLNSIMGDFETAERRGTVEGIETTYSSPVAVVQWDDMETTSRVLTVNIARVGSASFSDPHAKSQP